MSGVTDLLARRSRTTVVLLALVSVALVGAIDFWTGYELAFSVFYLLPVSMAGWYVGRRAGIVFSLLSAGVWFAADLSSGHLYSHPSFPYWNATVRLGFFLIVSALIAALRHDHEQLLALATTDPLTQLPNSRFFRRLVELERVRLQRSAASLTLAYLDLDGFKAVNDRLGHSVGDEVLREVAATMRHSLRAVDTVARLGGDEFAILLPETDATAAQTVLERVRSQLHAAMQGHGWPVTCSVGAVTFSRPPGSVDEAIRAADELMYAVKRSGKNSIRSHIVAPPPEPAAQAGP